ncbi:Ku protein [Paenibacillus xerothermodurans]|uniref:Non-homologous end joining protein Ku n=1 Tax=Paenibacillus xerothermodurans TaxID=1977292 RepID=A0A2W1N724_PAEXE|nr:Ku protein [Paenibacillus xerothermodurans]PZE20257.1 Ku protein [Paenibacillus xerothermodurans]
MHTIWKGAISFGLVNIPVRMYAATEDKGISMRMVHNVCGGPITYARTCKNCEVPVQNDAIVRGYEFQPGRYVTFEKEELDRLGGERSRAIEIQDFVDLSEIDPVYFQKTYYLGPGDTGANAYNLLYHALKNTGKIGIANITLRNKSSLAAIRLVDNCIAMETIFFPDEIRPASAVPNLVENAEVSDKELNMAEMLIGQLSTDFEPKKYEDVYRQRVKDAIDAKVAGEEITVQPDAPTTNVIDLMAALQASLDQVTDKPAPKKKTGKGKKRTETASG